jgi:hypothetical protein
MSSLVHTLQHIKRIKEVIECLVTLDHLEDYNFSQRPPLLLVQHFTFLALFFFFSSFSLKKEVSVEAASSSQLIAPSKLIKSIRFLLDKVFAYRKQSYHYSDQILVDIHLDPTCLNTLNNTNHFELLLVGTTAIVANPLLASAANHYYDGKSPVATGCSKTGISKIQKY